MRIFSCLTALYTMKNGLITGATLFERDYAQKLRKFGSA